MRAPYAACGLASVGSWRGPMGSVSGNSVLPVSTSLATSGRFRAPSSKRDKTAPGCGATVTQLVEPGGRVRGAGRSVLEVQRGGHDDQ